MSDLLTQRRSAGYWIDLTPRMLGSLMKLRLPNLVARNRSTSRSALPGFDPIYYLYWYPDVRAAGLDPLYHYANIGWREGRDPSAGFSTTGYLAANPDVAATDQNPLGHFVAVGFAEGRHGYVKDPAAPAPRPRASSDPLKLLPPPREGSAASLQGYVDEASLRLVRGWAISTEHSSLPAEIEIVLNGVVVGLARAADVRPDLLEKAIGTGHHGFIFNFDPPLDELLSHEIVIRRIADGFEIGRARLNAVQSASDPLKADVLSDRYDLPQGTALKSSQISESCIFHDGGFERTLVWFGGIHEPFISNHFLATYKINGLFFKDVNADWYMGGIEGFADSYETSAEWINNFLSKHTSGIRVFSGQSSGGYAALHFAHLLSPDLCIAFAPQTHNRNVDGQVLPWVEVTPIDRLYQDHPRDFPIRIHLSRSEEKGNPPAWGDWEQIAGLMGMDNVTVIRHPNDVHAVSLYLYGKRQFYKTIYCDMVLCATVDD